MADCKKYNGSTWQHSLRKLTTSTDTITTLPAVIYPNDTTATVGLKGNMTQTGTPTPQTPIQPQECGGRTGNLFDEKYPSISPTIQYMPMFVGDGTFTLSSTTPQMPNGAACLFLIAGIVSSGAGPQNKVYNEQSITVDSSNGYITIAYRNVSVYDPRNEKTMLNTGSTPLPYEPYGYKIPISSANTTTPVYLGEVESTRRIYKYEFTGSERWSADTENYYSFVPQTYGEGVPYSAIICSHCSNATNNNTGKAVFFKKTDFPDITTGEELKQYCSDQYAAGTPVTVWYVLATPTTGKINEPLMKIGDYADEVSNVSIPVTAGGDTISVDTTLQPSEVTINYKGWHPVQSVHERENGQWG